MEPEPSSAMPVWAPSLCGSIRMVAVTRVLPAAAGWTLTSPNGSTTLLSCVMARTPDAVGPAPRAAGYLSPTMRIIVAMGFSSASSFSPAAGRFRAAATTTVWPPCSASRSAG